ncbi:DNA primase [Caldivirga sp. UBA161]|uniref:DNA primase n=1 Tax=Caldivirga sp. UBA161 TaxID=1915569 RepID=UPI0025BE2DB1|nr:DNA primase [Caldivirga sp. UBA161]
MRTESCSISELTSKYPFTRSGRSIIEEAGVRVSELTSREFEPIIDDALSMLEALIKDGEHAKLSFKVREAAVSRYIAYALTASMDKRIWRRIADSESKIFSSAVKSSYLSKPNLECLKEIARELELRIIGIGELSSLVTKLLNQQGQVLMPKPFLYAVSIWDYLRNSPRNDPNWILGTRPIIHGYVLLTQHDAYRIIEETVENKAITMISKLNSNLDLFKPLISSVSDRLKAIEEASPQVKYRVTRRVLPKGDPPCIMAIINELKAGGNPSHMARFALATYLLHRCVAEGKGREECVEEVLEPFKHAADYNEKIARYQVEHLAGLRGGRKFYTPPSCQELNSLGLCPTNLGCGVKNPVQFIRGSTKVEGTE